MGSYMFGMNLPSDKEAIIFIFRNHFDVQSQLMNEAPEIREQDFRNFMG